MIPASASHLSFGGELVRGSGCRSLGFYEIERPTALVVPTAASQEEPAIVGVAQLPRGETTRLWRNDPTTTPPYIRRAHENPLSIQPNDWGIWLRRHRLR